MTPASAVTGDDLLLLLGRDVDDAAVQASLDQLARGMQPEVDANDDGAFVDWVTVNEIGLEYGFQDEAFVRAWDPERRGHTRLILTQLYFYGDTPRTRPFPWPLPFGLDFRDDRLAVQRKLAQIAGPCKTYIRDAWKLPDFDVTAAYRADTNLLESIYCHIPHDPWLPLRDEVSLAQAFPPNLFIGLFGLRWSDERLRTILAPLGYVEAMAGVRSEHMADLLSTHGLELAFAPSRELTMGDPRYPRSPALAVATFHASRDMDARAWAGELPCNLSFSDAQSDLVAKVGEAPDERIDSDRSGIVAWHLAAYSLVVVYSNVENRILRVSVMAPGYWHVVHADDGE